MREAKSFPSAGVIFAPRVASETRTIAPSRIAQSKENPPSG